MPQVIGISVETTGLDYHVNEVIRLSAYGDGGEIVFDKMFGIEHPETWSDASKRVSGFCEDDVAMLPTFREEIGRSDTTKELLDSSDILVAHGILFPLSFIGHAGVDVSGKRFGDTLEDYEEFSHRLRQNYGTSLKVASSVLRVSEFDQHDAPGKAKATYGVWCRLIQRKCYKLLDINEVRRRYRDKRKAGKAF